MPSTSGFDHLFALGISAIFGIYLLRCVAGALLFACAQLPTRWSAVASTCSVRVTPRFARRIAVLVLGLMGIGVAAGPTLPPVSPTSTEDRDNRRLRRRRNLHQPPSRVRSDGPETTEGAFGGLPLDTCRTATPVELHGAGHRPAVAQVVSRQ